MLQDWIAELRTIFVSRWTDEQNAINNQIVTKISVAQ